MPSHSHCTAHSDEHKVQPANIRYCSDRVAISVGIDYTHKHQPWSRRQTTTLQRPSLPLTYRCFFSLLFCTKIVLCILGWFSSSLMFSTACTENILLELSQPNHHHLSSQLLNLPYPFYFFFFVHSRSCCYYSAAAHVCFHCCCFWLSLSLSLALLVHSLTLLLIHSFRSFFSAFILHGFLTLFEKCLRSFECCFFMLCLPLLLILSTGARSAHIAERRNQFFPAFRFSRPWVCSGCVGHAANAWQAEYVPRRRQQ